MGGLRQLLFLLMISVGLAGVVFFELDSGGTPSEATLARRATTDQGQPAVQGNQRHPDPQQTAKDVATTLARPLFSPTRRPREAAKSVGATDPELSDVRLAGIVIQPDRRLAIFAVAGAKPRTLLLGEALNVATRSGLHELVFRIERLIAGLHDCTPQLNTKQNTAVEPAASTNALQKVSAGLARLERVPSGTR